MLLTCMPGNAICPPSVLDIHRDSQTCSTLLPFQDLRLCMRVHPSLTPTQQGRKWMEWASSPGVAWRWYRLALSHSSFLQFQFLCLLLRPFLSCLLLSMFISSCTPFTWPKLFSTFSSACPLPHYSCSELNPETNQMTPDCWEVPNSNTTHPKIQQYRSSYRTGKKSSAIFFF